MMSHFRTFQLYLRHH